MVIKLQVWKERGSCWDSEPDIFFPPASGRGVAAKAKKICKNCPVRRSCLEFFIEEYGPLASAGGVGIWGGFAGQELYQLIREMKKTGKPAWEIVNSGWKANP